MLGLHERPLVYQCIISCRGSYIWLQTDVKQQDYPDWKTPVYEFEKVGLSVSIARLCWSNLIPDFLPWRNRIGQDRKLWQQHIKHSLIKPSIASKNSKWVWSGNTTIINCKQTRGIVRKSHTTILRHQKDKQNNATSSLFPIEMIAQSNAQQI